MVPLTIPMMGASPAGGSSRKCALTMARNSDGVVRPGTRSRGHDRRHGEDHGIVDAERHLVLAEVEGHNLVLREIERPQPVPEPDRHVARPEKAQRRLDEDVAQPVAGNQRAAGLAPRRQRLADDGGGETGARLPRVSVEGRDPERARQSLVQRAGARHDLADGFCVGAEQQTGESEIVAHRRPRHPAALVEDPPRQPPGVDPQRPPLARREIDECKVGRRRAGKPFRGTDRLEIGKRGMVGREQQVIAVVDHHVERRVMIGPAAPAGLAGGLVHHDACAARRKAHRRGKTGKSGTDDMDRLRHQMKA